MKIARVLFAAVAIMVTFAACDSNPVGPAQDESRPVIGSGTGT